jgi:predicted 2-oxoglutarate/Fe(II)-dependent dioxygenase YbiX
MSPGFAYQAASLLRLPDFMPLDYCQALCSVGESAPSSAAKVVTSAGTRQNDHDRKSRVIRLPDFLLAPYLKRLYTLRSQFEDSLGCELARCESPQLLAYSRGDHFTTHRDTDDEPGLPPNIRHRVVSVVLFLNAPSAGLSEGKYGGGTLTFFDLSETATANGFRAPVVGHPGMLVAFPSGWLHYVTPVQHGARWTLVTWFAKAGTGCDGEGTTQCDLLSCKATGMAQPRCGT